MKVKQDSREATRAVNKNGTVFVCEINPEAKEVYLVGEFNNWDPQVDRMVKRKGAFQKTLYLSPGKYQYKFLIDGVWHTDPTAAEQLPNHVGTMNSVIRVSDSKSG